MSTNPSIYGSPEQWSPDHFTYTGSDRTKMFLIPYFGEGRTIQNIQFSQGSLKVGLIEGRLPRGAAVSNGYLVEKQLDESLSYCGLGNESVYSRITYFMPSATMFDNGFFAADKRVITNFAFTERRGGGSNFGLQDRGTARHGSTSRYSPKGYMTEDTVGVGGNKNQQVTPFAQIPIKNCVLVPTLTVCSGFDETAGTCTDIQHVRLWDYLSDDYNYNKTSHPYILVIGFDIWYSPSVDDIDEETGKPTVDRRNTAGNNDVLSRQLGNVAILSPLSVAKGMDADISNPDAGKLDDIYSYWFTGSDYANISNNSNSAMLFGASPCGYGNGSSVGMMTTTNQSNSINYGIIFPHENMVWRIAENNANRGFCYLVYYDGLQEWIRRQLACFGLFFTDDEQTVLNGALNDENMFLGTLESGIGHGHYTHGEDNESQPQWTWETTNDSDYDAKNPPRVDPNVYDGEMLTGDVAFLGTATQRYNVSAINLNLGLLPKLWDIMAMADPDVSKSDYSLDTFLTMNPIDAIVSLQYLPVKDMGTGDSVSIHLGNKDTGIAAATAKTSLRVDCGSIEIFPRCGENWISREMKLTLYLPFCGVVDLDPETYLNRFCNVEYLIDLTTGTCSAAVSFIDDMNKRVVTDIANGVCAIDLPVTGLQQQTLNSQLFNASESTKQLKVNNAFKGFKSLMGAVSNLNGNPDAAISSILGGAADFYNIFQSEKIADYNLQHTMIPTKMIGASGGLTGAMSPIKPTIIYSLPVYDDINYKQYGHSIGFACCISGSIAQFTGYTEITNVDLSGFEATATEKSMIRSALASGVYL